MSIVARFKAALPVLKADFMKAETYIKTLVVAVVTGAVADVAQLLSHGHEILLTPAGIVLLKHTLPRRVRGFGDRVIYKIAVDFREVVD